MLLGFFFQAAPPAYCVCVHVFVVGPRPARPITVTLSRALVGPSYKKNTPWLKISLKLTVKFLKPLELLSPCSTWKGFTGIFLSNFQGGAFEILDLFLKQISDLLTKLWTFQYAAGFRGPGILIKRSTIVDLSGPFFKTNFGPFEKIVDLSVCRRVQRSRYLN